MLAVGLLDDKESALNESTSKSGSATVKLYSAEHPLESVTVTM